MGRNISVGVAEASGLRGGFVDVTEMAAVIAPTESANMETELHRAVRLQTIVGGGDELVVLSGSVIERQDVCSGRISRESRGREGTPPYAVQLRCRKRATHVCEAPSLGVRE
jgi:hypothetical protein